MNAEPGSLVDARPQFGSNGCIVTYEAVEDAIDEGDTGCPICGMAPAPPWWAEVAFDIRSINREHREAAAEPRERCLACDGRGWLPGSEAEAES